MIKALKNGGAAVNSMMLMFVQVITTLVGLIVTKLLAINFSLVEYGTYAQAMLVINTATSLSILGLTNATNYFYNRTDSIKEQEKYLSAIFSIQYIIGSLITILIILFRGEIANYFENTALSNILLVISCTPVLTNLISMYQVLFISIGQAHKIAIRNFIISFLKLLFVLIACYIVKNITFVLFIILILDILQFIYFTIVFKREKYRIRINRIDISLAKEILSFSIPMAIFILTNSLSRDMDKFIISALGDTEMLAIYTNASKILPFDMLTSSLITILIPIITRLINQKNYLEAKGVFKLYLKIGCVLTCTFVGGAIAVSKELMIFLYDEKYIAGLSVFIIYLLIDMIRFANVTTILSGAGKTKILMSISVSALGLNAIFNILAFKILGMIGPAIVTLIVTFIMTGLLLYFGAREIRTSIRDLFDFKEMFILFFEIIVIGIGAYYFSLFLKENIHSDTFSLIISYGVYLVIMFGLNCKTIISCLKKLNTYK